MKCKSFWDLQTNFENNFAFAQCAEEVVAIIHIPFDDDGQKSFF